MKAQNPTWKSGPYRSFSVCISEIVPPAHARARVGSDHRILNTFNEQSQKMAHLAYNLGHTSPDLK